MKITFEQLQSWIDAPSEDEHLEFKEAKSRYGFEELVRYCVALANEGGGRMILGVTNSRPRRVIGSRAFNNPERIRMDLYERLRLRIEVEEVQHPDGPVIVFTVPPRPLGTPIHYQGAYWMRRGESLVPMTPDQLRRIFDEAVPDYSAEICRAATINDLDPSAIEYFRTRWSRKSGNEALAHIPDEQLLRDAELIIDSGVTYAALILMGTRVVLGRHMSHAEVIFEYRSTEVSGPAQQRLEFRQGFFLFIEKLWYAINARNDMQHYQEGLFVWDIPTFNEVVVREAILNAISHRDYRLSGSVFVRQYPRKMEIVSPGGLPAGITQENILWRQLPRNRRIAEALSKCGLVERSGQGMNLMYEQCVRESKPGPDFAGTDDNQVSITLQGDVQDTRFLRFLEQVGRKTLASFSTPDFIVLDYIHKESPVPDEHKPNLPKLAEMGIIERVGRGRGVRYILSRSLYGYIGKKGVYTRKRGLDKETNKQLLLKHITDNRKDGSALSELIQVLPSLSRRQVQNLIYEMRDEGKIHLKGQTRAGLWYPGTAPITLHGNMNKGAITVQNDGAIQSSATGKNRLKH
ncbi:MAG: ATP-binding protein [bacterium]